MKSVTQFYDELGPMYDLIWGQHRHHGYWEPSDTSHCIESATHRLLERVITPLRLQPHQNIADIGSGTGACARYIAEKYHVNISAIDPSSTHNHQHHSVIPLQENWLHNSLPDNSLDAAYAIESLPHVSDPQRFLIELFRTLKPGSKATIATWTSASHPSLCEKMLLHSISKEGALYGLRTNEHLHKMIKVSGLTLINQHNLSSSVSQTWTLIFKRAIHSTLTHPRAFAFAFRRLFLRKKLYLLSAPRLRFVYQTGCLQYVVYELQKPLAEPTQKSYSLNNSH